ncbi:MAG: hypothetical protein M1821_007526 [Bathelium mastoideum]|nr:MAG: hypothetical protein M1821_007526 [Bathelium mastoideum]KAI9695030.1 MAG: hypothetical protein M1822_000647 [Bathelium mastoideum]
MADIKPSTDGPSPFSPDAYDFTKLPDYDNDFLDEADLNEFARALAAPETSPSQEDLLTSRPTDSPVFITALNDWRPVRQRVKPTGGTTSAATTTTTATSTSPSVATTPASPAGGTTSTGRPKKPSRRARKPRRGTDETREGYVYTLLQWPLLIFVLAWIAFLGVGYAVTRGYVYLYEHWVAWRGERQRLRAALQRTSSYAEWVAGARKLDRYLGNEKWKEMDAYAYYDDATVRRVRNQLAGLRRLAESAENDEGRGARGGKGKGHGYGEGGRRAIEQLRSLCEACIKSNFAGIENPRLYSETYYGTKNLVQSFVDEVEASLKLLLSTRQLNQDAKAALFKHLQNNFGRTALCLSGGATFAYYHFGVAKALLDANLLPQVITGTSGGALIAGLLATRTDAELKRLLVPALAGRITACQDDFRTWFGRWRRTGARFDALEWARRCAWFTRGSLTFAEAYARTGRILNVSCVPSDPHSPTILANYLTAPDCVVWSAVLASAAVPGILNPVVLMRKGPDGALAPYSFGSKWKDGSLRTDIPLRALNLHFKVNFSIVSQVNPHVNLFFFSSRGTVGRPVTHRRGRGWRGGFLGSAVEQYIKLDLNKWLKVLRHLELLPRPLGQDWSEIWLQRFSGTITIWPKSVLSDFWYILSDPSVERLARMIHVGQQSTFPKLQFIANRMKAERLIEQGRRETMGKRYAIGDEGDELGGTVLSEEELEGLIRKEARKRSGGVAPAPLKVPQSRTRERLSPSPAPSPRPKDDEAERPESPSLGRRVTHWLRSSLDIRRPPSVNDGVEIKDQRRASVMSEIGRQSMVFFDDSDAGAETDTTDKGDTDAEDATEEHDESRNAAGILETLLPTTGKSTIIG